MFGAHCAITEIGGMPWARSTLLVLRSAFISNEARLACPVDIPFLNANCRMQIANWKNGRRGESCTPKAA